MDYLAANIQQYDVLRIEAGLPAAGSELNKKFTPLDIGSGSLVSGTNGCYTGQEVLIGQMNFNKITQHLRIVLLTHPAESGVRLWVNDRPAGTLTSVAYSPSQGWIGLAMIKRPHDNPETILTIRTGDEIISHVAILS